MGCSDSKAAETKTSTAPAAKPQEPAATAAKPETKVEEDVVPVCKVGTFLKDKKIKLIYFNGAGRGELIRIMFAIKGVEYVDHRVEFEDWAALKPTTPQGSLPILEVDDQTLVQSTAIARLVAKDLDLLGKDSEGPLADDIVSFSPDLMGEVPGVLFAPEDEKAAKLEEAKEGIKPKLQHFNDMLAKRTSTFAVGETITLADLRVFLICEFLIKYIGEEFVSEYPALKDLMNKVKETPEVTSYLEKRPAQAF